MLADFFLLRKQRLAVHELYETLGPFSYSCGFNAIGLTSALLAVAPCAPGLLARLSGSDLLTRSGSVGVAFARAYDTAWFTSVLVGAGCCVGLSWCFPRYQGIYRAPGDSDGKRGFTRLDEAEPAALRASYS
jgi:cytosine/uracil/thiamine/allantoin permease